MDKSIAYDEQINNPEENINVENWHLAVEAYEKSQYRESIRYLFLYLDDRIQIPEKEDFAIKISHGSIVLEMKVEGDYFSLQAPFIRISQDATNLAILRQTTELNFTYLVLSQVIKKDDELYFQYRDKVSNCEPYKMYSLFEEICCGADYYDDIFITKYKAEFIQKPKLNHFTTEQKEEAYTKFQNILNEALENCQYLENKRYYASSCDLLATSLLRIDYIFAPQGILGSDLNEILEMMYEEDEPQNISQKARSKIKKLLTIERKKFDSSLFYPKFFIPQKKRAELPLIQDYFKSPYETSANTISSGAKMAASLSLLFAIYDIFYKYRIPAEIDRILTEALKKSDQKKWEEVSRILYNSIETILKLERLSQKEPTSKNTDRKNTGQSNGNSVVKSVVDKIVSFFK